MLSQAQVPRMMADVLLAVTMVVYAIFRMNEIGVNLASLITTSAVLTGAIAFSMQAMLGNLWGGIASQADNTCWPYRRPGSASMGWWGRSSAFAGVVRPWPPNDGENRDDAQCSVGRQPRDGAARRATSKIPWRRAVEFFVAYDARSDPRHCSRSKALARAEIPNVAASPAATCTCRAFDDNSIRYAVLYWLSDPWACDQRDRFAGPRARFRDARTPPYGHPAAAPRDSDARCGECAGGSHDCPRTHRPHRRAVAPRAVRRIDRRRTPRARERVERGALRGG